MPKFYLKIPEFFSQKGITSEVLFIKDSKTRCKYCALLNLNPLEEKKVAKFAKRAKENGYQKRKRQKRAARTSEPEVQRVTTMPLELASADAAPPAEPHGASPGSARASSSAGTATSARSKRSATARCTESEGSDSGSESEAGGVAAASATETDRSISRISVTYSKMRKDILTCNLGVVVEDLRKNHCSVEDIITIMQERSRVNNLPMPKFKEKIPEFFSQKGITSEVLTYMGITDRRRYCASLELSTSEIDDVKVFARKAKDNIYQQTRRQKRSARTSKPEDQSFSATPLEHAPVSAAPHGTTPSSVDGDASAQSKRSATARYTEREGSDMASEYEGEGVESASATETGRSISRIRLRYKMMREDILTCSFEEAIEDLNKQSCSDKVINKIMKIREAIQTS